MLHRLLLFDFSRFSKSVRFFYPYRRDNSIPAGINHYDVTVEIVMAAEKKKGVWLGKFIGSQALVIGFGNHNRLKAFFDNFFKMIAQVEITEIEIEDIPLSIKRLKP